jgi:ketosteroid isomerase-like protein
VKNVKKLEEQLKKAMSTSDLATLDSLLSPDLIFTNHLGQVVSKSQDIELHRSGLLKIESLETLEEVFNVRENTIVVSVLVKLLGTYAGNNANGKFRFTRVWALNAQHQWQVIAAHSTLLS